jgi:hypothetical protein
MMVVEVIQFISPRGEQRERSTELPDDCAVGYEALRRKNCRLTAEVLMTGSVSQCIEHEEGDYDIEICANGPEIQEKLADMVRRFDGAAFDRWLAEINN